MKKPTDTESTLGMEVVYTDNGSTGTIEAIRDDGLPVIRFDGCRTPRYCRWDEIRPTAPECKGHHAGINGAMGETIYCDGSCRRDGVHRSAR